VTKPVRIAVIGGGISGLSAAHRLRELAPEAEIRLFEASGRLGGILRTVHDGPYLIEQSADNFITNVPWGIDLCRRLGLEADLLTTDENRRRAYVVHRGKLLPVPQGFSLMAPAQILPILKTPLLSPLGKIRLLLERFVPARRPNPDESLGSFVRRRFGKQVFDRLVQPLIGGIYTADPEKLSLAATMPRFLEMERTSGSLIKAMRKSKSVGRAEDAAASGARYGMFVAPRGGMSSLVDRLVERLPAGAVQLHTLVDRLQQNAEAKWQLSVAQISLDRPIPPEELIFDGVIVAAPAYRAATLLEQVDRELATTLKAIPYAGTVVVTLVYPRAAIRNPLDGFGFVVPAREKRQILAASFASNKFPGRAPAEEVLIRVFIGGACQPELVDLPDERLRAIAVTELAELLAIQAEPQSVSIVRWPQSMPQYHVGHLSLIEAIFTRVKTHPGLALAGSAYQGVGIPHCIHSGELAAEELLRCLELA